MSDDSLMRLAGLVIGDLFLLLALASTISRVTLSVFIPWLGRQIRYRERPRAFIALVLLYWLLGAAAVVVAVVGPAFSG